MISIMVNKTNTNSSKKNLLIVVLWIAIWQVLSSIIKQEVLLPSPIHVLFSLLQLVKETSYYRDIFNSLYHVLYGYFLALIFSCFLSLLSARNQGIKSIVSPLFTFIKSTPVASFILLAFLLFGSQGLSSFICFLMSLPIMYTNLLEGLTSIPKTMLDAAKVYNMSSKDQFRYIYLPNAIPFFLSGCSVSLGLAWKSGIAAEVIGIARYSLGERLYNAKLFLDTSQLFAVTITIILLSWLSEKVILFFMHKACSLLK